MATYRFGGKLGPRRTVAQCPVSSGNSSGRRNTLTKEVAMNIRKRRSDRSGRHLCRHQVDPLVAGRDERRRFWAAVDFPDDETMRISHEAIYQALFVQGRGALRRELTACLRTGRALRMPRARTRGRGKTFISPEIMISQRPAEAADRAVPGHWEGDLILGLGSSAIGTLVERTTRFTPAATPAAHDGPWPRGSREERTRTRRTWCRGGARGYHAHDHHLARATASIADLGSRG